MFEMIVVVFDTGRLNNISPTYNGLIVSYNVLALKTQTNLEFGYHNLYLRSENIEDELDN